MSLASQIQALATRIAAEVKGKVAKAGDTMTGVLQVPSMAITPAVGAAKGRFGGLSGVEAWTGMFLNAQYVAGSGWLLDDSAKPGWFFKLDSRAGLSEFAVWRIPAGAGYHVDEALMFKVDVNGLMTVVSRITGVANATGAADALPKGQADSLYTYPAVAGGDVPSNLRAQANLSGGGTVTLSSAYSLKWSDRFIVVSNGNGTHFSTSGYFDILMPAASTTITGVGGASNVVVDANGIAMADWTALYYVLPIGGASTSVPANFRIVALSAALKIPDHWILLAVHNADTSAGHFVKLAADGRILRAGAASSPSSPFPQHGNKTVIIYTTTVPARPAGATYVEWQGQVDPAANAIAGDTWVPTV